MIFLHSSYCTDDGFRSTDSGETAFPNLDDGERAAGARRNREWGGVTTGAKPRPSTYVFTRPVRLRSGQAAESAALPRCCQKMVLARSFSELQMRPCVRGHAGRREFRLESFSL